MAAAGVGKASKRLLELEVKPVDGLALRIFANGMPIVRVTHESRLAPAVEGMLVGYAVRTREDCAVFHAASIAVHDRAILLCGGKGSGKSTLALVMGLSGAKYLGDELALVRFADRRVEAFPKAVTLKEGSFSLFPDQQTHDDPVRGPVRYFLPADTASIGQCFASALIVFPRFDPAAEQTRINDIEPHETAFELIRQCFGGLERDARTMDIIAALSNARAVSLRYSDTVEAARSIHALVHRP
jgi:hypothetical protein